eukprot:208052-Pelagomonas_calceolata.AAC.1
MSGKVRGQESLSKSTIGKTAAHQGPAPCPAAEDLPLTGLASRQSPAAGDRPVEGLPMAKKPKKAAKGDRNSQAAPP